MRNPQYYAGGPYYGSPLWLPAIHSYSQQTVREAADETLIDGLYTRINRLESHIKQLQTAIIELKAHQSYLLRKVGLLEPVNFEPVKSNIEISNPKKEQTDLKRKFPATTLQKKRIVRKRWGEQEIIALETIVNALLREFNINICQMKRGKLPNIKWSDVASSLAKQGYQRTGKRCRERWLNNHDPRIIKGPLMEEELDNLLRIIDVFYLSHTKIPWTNLSAHHFFYGRTPLQLKNAFHLYLEKNTPKQPRTKKRKFTIASSNKPKKIQKTSDLLSRGLFSSTSQVQTYGVLHANPITDFVPLYYSTPG